MRISASIVLTTNTFASFSARYSSIEALAIFLLAMGFFTDAALCGLPS